MTYDFFAEEWSGVHELALRAVVELHKPFETTPPWEYKYYTACSVCKEWTTDGAYSVAYPCPTIQAIEKELG